MWTERMPHGRLRRCSSTAPRESHKEPGTRNARTRNREPGTGTEHQEPRTLNGGSVVETSADLFTIGVFQDLTWADKGLQALRAQGFPPDILSLIVKDTPESAAFAEQTFGEPASTMEIRAWAPHGYVDRWWRH